MKNIIVTGGTGLTGTALCTKLAAAGYQVTVLTRFPSQHRAKPGIRYAGWDVERQAVTPEIWAQADAVIHLAGAHVAEKRWTAARKQTIEKSRTAGGQLIVRSLAHFPNRVKTVVTASAIGWYGPDEARTRGDAFTEDMPAYPDFLGRTCQAWEQSVDGAAALGLRVVKLRTGIVLSNKGGALHEFRKPLRFGLAPVFGSGQQVVSWIHIDDLCALYQYVLENETASGPYNAVSPQPVSSRQLVQTLARTLRGSRYITMPVPAFLLTRLLGEMSIELLKSATVSPRKIEETGFRFQYPDLEAALQELFAG